MVAMPGDYANEFCGARIPDLDRRISFKSQGERATIGTQGETIRLACGELIGEFLSGLNVPDTYDRFVIVDRMSDHQAPTVGAERQRQG
jgi:hypothetical protein